MSLLLLILKHYSFPYLVYSTDKKDYETKPKDEKSQYKLTTEQLQYATKIRRATDEFRRKSFLFLKKFGKTGHKSLKILRNLAKDKSIFITKADKGRAIIILDRDEYINKLKFLLMISQPLNKLTTIQL